MKMHRRVVPAILISSFFLGSVTFVWGSDEESPKSEEISIVFAEEYAKAQINKAAEEYLNNNPPISNGIPIESFGTSMVHGIGLALSAGSLLRAETDKQRGFALLNGATHAAVLSGAPSIAFLATPYVGLAIVAVQVADAVVSAQHAAELMKTYAAIAETHAKAAALRRDRIKKDLEGFQLIFDQYAEASKEVFQINGRLNELRKIELISPLSRQQIESLIEDLRHLVSALRRVDYYLSQITLIPREYLNDKVVTLIEDYPNRRENILNKVAQVDTSLNDAIDRIARMIAREILAQQQALAENELRKRNAIFRCEVRANRLIKDASYEGYLYWDLVEKATQTRDSGIPLTQVFTEMEQQVGKTNHIKTELELLRKFCTTNEYPPDLYETIFTKNQLYQRVVQNIEDIERHYAQFEIFLFTKNN